MAVLRLLVCDDLISSLTSVEFAFAEIHGSELGARFR
jgi:hypothetical protein